MDVDRTIEPGDLVLEVGGLKIGALHTPGHTAGMLNFVVNGSDVFTGDTLFKGSVGGVNAPGSTSFDDLKSSIMDMLMKLRPRRACTPATPTRRRSATSGRTTPSSASGAAWTTSATSAACVWDARRDAGALGPDYDGGHKAWIRWDDSGEDDIVPGCQVVRRGPRPLSSEGRGGQSRSPVYWARLRAAYRSALTAPQTGHWPGPALRVEHRRALVLLGLGGGGRIARPPTACPGRYRELVLAAVGAGRADRRGLPPDSQAAIAWSCGRHGHARRRPAWASAALRPRLRGLGLAVARSATRHGALRPVARRQSSLTPASEKRLIGRAGPARRRGDQAQHGGTTSSLRTGSCPPASGAMAGGAGVERASVRAGEGAEAGVRARIRPAGDLGRRRREVSSTVHGYRDSERYARASVTSAQTGPAVAPCSRGARHYLRVAPRLACSRMTVTLPDGTPLELPDGATGADAAAPSARAWRAPRWRQGRRRAARPAAPAARRRQGRDRHREAAPARTRSWLIRHDAAHVLAAAVMELYPGVKISIGPPIENGFYYDFEFPEGVTVSDADFERIEAEDARARQGRRATSCARTSPWPRRSSASAPRARTTRSS